MCEGAGLGICSITLCAQKSALLCSVMLLIPQRSSIMCPQESYYAGTVESAMNNYVLGTLTTQGVDADDFMSRKYVEYGFSTIPYCTQHSRAHCIWRHYLTKCRD